MNKQQCSFQKCFLHGMNYITDHIITIPNAYLDDRNFVLFLIQRYGFALFRLPHKYLYDREIVLIAVKNYGSSLRLIAPLLKYDREIVLAAVK